MPTDLVDLSIDVKLFKGRGQGKVEECKHIFVVGWWILSHFLKEEEILCSKWLTNEMEISEIIRDQRSLGINIFCRIHTLCIPLWEDLSINLRPDKTSVTNFSTECLSDTVKSIVLPKNLTGFVWIDGIISPLKEKGEISVTLPLSITIDLDLEALKVILAQFKARHNGLEELE